MADLIPGIEMRVPGRDGRDGILLWVPYRVELVTELKGSIPRPRRYWDEGIGAWWIDAREEARATRIVLHHFRSLARLAGPGEETVIVSADGMGFPSRQG